MALGKTSSFGGSLPAAVRGGALLAALTAVMAPVAWGAEARTGVDAEAMAEASAPSQRPRHIASSHAYEAFLMARRALDAGDVEAARRWLRQVLAFDPEAGEAQRLLRELAPPGPPQRGGR